MAQLALGVVLMVSSLGCRRPAEPETDEAFVRMWDAFWGGSQPDTVAVVALTGSAPLDEGGTVQTVFGAQGGRMLDLGAEATGVDPTSARFGFRLVDPRDERLVGGGFALPQLDETGVVRGRLLFESSARGNFLLQVRVRDALGVQGTTELRVNVQ